MPTIRDIANSIDATISGTDLDRVITPASSIVTHDSRRAMPGGVFVAITGAQADGNLFVGEATTRGANIIISERPRPSEFPEAGGLVWLQVADARKALACAAAEIHGRPSTKLKLAGVTGTNGKTTVAHLMEAIYKTAGFKSAVMGTTGLRIGDEQFDAQFTTPESPDVQDFLRRALEAGVTHAVMEVSSHALHLHRADELKFAAAAFTNLTQDHLDLHGTMDAYLAAKRKLFDGSIGSIPEQAVINMDDPAGAGLKAAYSGVALTFALDARADIRIIERNGARKFNLNGLRFNVHTPAGNLEVNSPLVGRPFASNILCAIGLGLALGFELETIGRGISSSRGAAGRFERVSGQEDDITVIVDYAHTPDALANVMRIVRDAQGHDQFGHAKGRLVTLMGCGGDRDRTKRPLMGEEAASRSDWVIATSDNPRSEDPIRILNDIRVGLDRVSKQYEMIVDRKDAIYRAILSAMPGDVVLLAGKGHETYQILATGKIDFDDRAVAREALAERRSFRSQI
jgi:UDP-N-acetylmuramoyl-L-alanyl-D-glutamate--2,6-diaminopimelate ligase